MPIKVWNAPAVIDLLPSPVAAIVVLGLYSDLLVSFEFLILSADDTQDDT